MGLFNWAMKGVKAERDNAPEASTPAEETQQVEALQNISSELKQTTANMLLEEQAEHSETDEQTPKEVASAVLFNFSPNAPIMSEPMNMGYNPNFNGAFMGGTIGNRHILVSSPKNQPELFAVVEHLKTNEAVIVNFEGLITAEAQRFVDFLSGVACGLGGSIQALDNYKYIITPSGIGVR